MKKMLIIGLLILFFTTSGLAQQVGFQGRPITNNLVMPTGYTLNQGEFIVGIGPIGFGITDNIQLGTNILLFLFQVYNGNLKISLLKTESLAFAVGAEVAHFNWDVLGEEGETGFTAISPYVVLSPKLGPQTTIHLGGKYSYFEGDAEIDSVEVVATSEGSSIFVGWEQSMSPRTKFLFEGGYDITFEGYRVGGGVLFGWAKFRLKLGVNYWKPKDSDGFTLPAIGLWWRFAG